MATTVPDRDYATTPPRVQRTPSRTWRIADWTIRGLLALAFVGAGATKLMGVPESVAVFEALDARFGTGTWFLYLTAVLEVVGGLLIFVPGRTKLAALLLLAVSAGALATNLFLVPSSPVAAIVLLALSLAVLWIRRPRRA